jgi:hypothetical protein
MFDVTDEFVFEGVWYTVVEVEFDGYHVVDVDGNERFILEANL